MKKIFSCLSLLLLVNFAQAQPAQDSVVATINNFFAGIKKADTLLVKSTLASNAVLHTIDDRTGTTKVEDEKIAAFVRQVSQIAPGIADEQFTVESVRIDGALASVWTPYKFYYKGKFSHCGVNSFQLVRIANEWKIQYIIDTRRKSNCL